MPIDSNPAAERLTQAMDELGTPIREEFNAHALNERAERSILYVRRAFSVLLGVIDFCVPSSRPRSLVVTKLQEACMFAIRGIAEDPTSLKNP